MYETFEFYLNNNNKNFTVVQFFHTDKRNPELTMIGKVITNKIPTKFVQRYVDKLVSLGYNKEVMSKGELIILTSKGGQL